MGLYDRDYMRQTASLAPNRHAVQLRRWVLAAALVGAFLYLISSLWWTTGPSSYRKKALQRVLARERVGWAGIGWDGVSEPELQGLGVPCGLRVTQIAANGPADKAGLKPGDIIVGLNGSPFADVFEFQGSSADFAPGDELTLAIVRNGQESSVRLRLVSYSEIEPLAIKSNVGLGL